MSALDFNQLKNFANLALGNSPRFNCKVRGYRGKISLSIITAYLTFFTLGIFAGDLSATHAINVENAISMMSTVLIASLGTNILYNCYLNKIKNRFISAAVVAIMGAQAAYVFNLFSVPIVNSLFQLATIGSMLVLFVVSQSSENVK